MPQLKLKPNHKAIRDYYATLQRYEQYDIRHEGAVSNPFAFLLDACAKQANATLVPQHPMRTPAGNRIVLDGVILDAYRIPFAYYTRRHPRSSVRLPIREPVSVGMDHRPISRQNRQTERDCERSKPYRPAAIYRRPHRPRYHCQSENGRGCGQATSVVNDG